jgi:ribosome-associated translation inhibitor RaiA
MTIPLQITFRHMPPSAALENRVRVLAERLAKFSARITSCHVVIEKPHQSSTQGGLFDVHIGLAVPGSEISVRRSHSSDPKHENPYVALRDAFNTARRCLQDHERVRRGHVKAHAIKSADAPRDSEGAPGRL